MAFHVNILGALRSVSLAFDLALLGVHEGRNTVGLITERSLVISLSSPLGRHNQVQRLKFIVNVERLHLDALKGVREATRANSRVDLEFTCLCLRLDLVVYEARDVADSLINYTLKWNTESILEGDLRFLEHFLSIILEDTLLFQLFGVFKRFDEALLNIHLTVLDFGHCALSAEEQVIFLALEPSKILLVVVDNLLIQRY